MLLDAWQGPYFRDVINTGIEIDKLVDGNSHHHLRRYMTLGSCSRVDIGVTGAARIGLNWALAG